jgi:hypothetical protein
MRKGKIPDPDQDADPRGPKTYESYGSGSGTLLKKDLNLISVYRSDHPNHFSGSRSGSETGTNGQFVIDYHIHISPS